MDIILIAGLWLDGSAWDDVVPALRDLGHRPVPLAACRQGTGPASATLDDQVTAVLAATWRDPAAALPRGARRRRLARVTAPGRRSLGRRPSEVAGPPSWN